MAAQQQQKFGAFGGVFTPSVLTILGVIMFLRAGWVVGNAGLKQALTILLIANSITLLTTLSLSAIATNTRVGTGGAYFLISRSLGLEIGGSIGLPLFLAQAISVTFYIIGFTESLRVLWPELDARLVSAIVLVILFLIAWVGAGLATKTQYLIMALLGLSLVSFFTGYSPVPDWTANFDPAYLPGQTFWTVFAIYFPAVTGILTGVSMSGDLKDPSKSIPRGTLAAVLVTFGIYAAQMIWLSLNASRWDLVTDNMVMKRVSRVESLIFVGLWAATLSSALACLLAAPRTLQALGRDRVLPGFLARGSGPANEPKIALVLTFFVALACVALGEIDVIAPLITMFFLTTYGMVNLASGLEALISNPSYRPTFRVHWVFSLAGAAGCFVTMFLLNAGATVLALLIAIGIYSLLKRRQFESAWGDVRSGLWFAVTRVGLLQLSASRQHVRNWRPVLLVLAGNPKTRLPLVEFASQFESRRGLLFLSQIISGPWQKLVTLQASSQKSLQDFIQENRLSAVAKTVLADDFEHGVTTLLQVAGVGSLQPNTVLMGWSEDALKQALFTRTVRRILELQKNLLIFAQPDLPSEQLKPVIDVWWGAKENGSFMLTLAHLLQQNARWRDHSVRVLRIIEHERGKDQAESAMRQMIRAARIDADVKIVVANKPPLEVICHTSELSEITFVGFALDQENDGDTLSQSYSNLVAGLKGNSFIAKSWHDLEL